MERLKSRSHMIDIVFALALFCVFAVSALMVALVGARVYSNTIENMNINFDTRGSVVYVATKIRQNDEAGMISVSDLDGIPALLMEQELDGEIYQTWIYHYDGALREIFTSKGSGIGAEFGAVIMEIDSFTIEQTADNLFRISSLDSRGNPVEMVVAARTGS